ncbi:outer membrane beta-barrel family protein [Labilibaculum euxinus]
MYRYLLTLLFIVQTFASYPSNLRGKVIDDQAISLEYFTVAILLPQDSSIIIGGAFVDGYFEFEDLKVDQCLIQISSVGYQTVTQNINFSAINSIDIGTIQMKNLELNEITVFAKRPTFRQVEGRLLIDVKGTALSEAGDLFDALKRSPGLVVDNNNNITVSGKGTPIVFINNREVQNKAEIEALQSDDVMSIEIDRNPSAEYSASGNAVVRIKTKKITKDKVNLQVYHRDYFARKLSTQSGIQLNSKINKTSASINYSYRDFKSKNFEDAYEINTHSEYTISNNNSTIRIPKTKSHNMFLSLNQEINSKNNLGFQYSYISTNKNQDSDSKQTINKTNDGVTNRNILKHRDEDKNLHIYNLNYQYDIDSTSSLSIIGDYSSSANHSTEDIGESNITSNSNLKSLIDNQNNYNIYSGKLDYKICVFQSINLQTGVKASKVTNNGKVTSVNQITATENYQINDKIDDRISAAYFNLESKLNNFKLEAGFRYEYTDTEISSNEKMVLDSTYGHWFPSVLINKEFSDHVNVTLSYAKKIDRPTFNELSTDITYFDALSYSTGNPKIKPTISHNLDLSFGLFKNLSVNFAYSYEKNARILSAVSDNSNPDIVKYTPVNISQAEYLNLNIDYNYSGKNLNSTFSFGGKKPFIEIPYMNELRKIRNSSWYFQTNNDYSITSRTSIFANYLYNSSSKDLMTHFESSSKLSVGVNTSFFSKKLNVAIMANDIFDTSDNSWEDKYGNIVAGSNPDNDNTWVRFSIKYNFNNFKGGAKKKSASESELNRL